MIGFSRTSGVAKKIVSVSRSLIGTGSGFASSFRSAADFVLKIGHGISNFVLFDYSLIKLRKG